MCALCTPLYESGRALCLLLTLDDFSAAVVVRHVYSMPTPIVVYIVWTGCSGHVGLWHQVDVAR